MGGGHHSTSSGTGSRPSALHQGVMGGVRVPALAHCGAEVGAPLFAGQGGEGHPGMVPSCSGQPRFQVIQDRLWSGQSACSRLLGSGAGQTLHPGRSCGAMASPSLHRQLPRGVARELLAGWVWGHRCPLGRTWRCWVSHSWCQQHAALCPLPAGVRAQAATCG